MGIFNKESIFLGTFSTLQIIKTFMIAGRRYVLNCLDCFRHREMGGQEVVNLLEACQIVGDGVAVGEILDEVGVDVELGELVLEGVDLRGVIGVVGGVVEEKGGSCR